MRTIRTDNMEYHIDPRGEKQGECKVWFDFGIRHLMSLTHYKDDLRHGEYKKWYMCGQRRIHARYKSGWVDGEYKEWHNNGELWEHCHYIDGALQGKYKRWYRSGHLEVECFYDNNDIHGELRNWYENVRTPDVEFYFRGADITNEVAKLVKDIRKITPEESLVIRLRYGF